MGPCERRCRKPITHGMRLLLGPLRRALRFRAGLRGNTDDTHPGNDGFPSGLTAHFNATNLPHRFRSLMAGSRSSRPALVSSSDLSCRRSWRYAATKRGERRTLLACREARTRSVSMQRAGLRSTDAPAPGRGRDPRVCFRACSPSGPPNLAARAALPGVSVRPNEASPARGMGRTRIGAGIKAGGSQNVT